MTREKSNIKKKKNWDGPRLIKTKRMTNGAVRMAERTKPEIVVPLAWYGLYNVGDVPLHQ